MKYNLINVETNDKLTEWPHTTWHIKFGDCVWVDNKMWRIVGSWCYDIMIEAV